MFHRGSRGFRRRSGLRPVIKSYKKVINFASASFTAGFQTEVISTGVDSVAIGQTGPTDGNVPTGALVKYIEVQFAVSNVVLTPCFLTCTLQYTESGQSFIDPDTMGGSPQRNQCLHMDMFTVGEGQNSLHKFRFKVPKGMQRIREGRRWGLCWNTSATVNRKVLMIYKVYQ